MATIQDDIVTNCTADIFTKIQASDTLLDKKAFDIVSEDDLTFQAKLVKPPFVGVMYEGTRAIPGNDPSRQGLAADCYIAVVLAMASSSIASLNTKSEAARLLGLLRKNVRGTTAPSGHKWRFVSEAYVGVVADKAMYIQRWATAVMLTS